MPLAEPTWTIEQVLALPDDGNRYELLAGELTVTPAPSFAHQRAVFEVQAALHQYVSRHGLGWAMASPADIVLGPDTLVQPDVLVVPHTGGPPPRQWNEVSRLLLAAEILSPSTRRRDRDAKRRLYQRYGVPTYWVVDVEQAQVEVWTPRATRAERAVGELTWQPTPAQPPLTLDLPALFATIAR
jgi:Uma2 family endonuclease